MLTVGSVCSGAGGFDLGFRRAGYRTLWLCEYDQWRRRLLAQNFPGVPCHPDLTTLEPDDLDRPDVLIGGTPCQDLSVAGQRAGLDGERSGLFWDYMRVRNRLGVEWCVWENVAGALSSNQGLDFAQVLAAMVGADVPVPASGWAGAGVVAGPWGGACWRLLDAQHFGVPQRRRRVFVVGRLGGPCPPEVLLEPAGSGGDSQAGGGAGPRTTGAPVSGTLGARGKLGGNTSDIDRAGAYVANGVAAPLTRGSSRNGVSEPGRRQEDDVNIVVNALDRQAGGPDDNSAQAGHLIAGALTRRVGKGVDSDGAGMPLIARTLRAEGFDASEDGTGRGTPLVVPHDAGPDLGPRLAGLGQGRADGGVAGTVRSHQRPGSNAADVVLTESARRGVGERHGTDAEGWGRQAGAGLPGGSSAGVGAPVDADGVRAADGLAGRLDGPAVTAFDPQPDGRRYAACGDGVVANVAEWIARRLAATIDQERQLGEVT